MTRLAWCQGSVEPSSSSSQSLGQRLWLVTSNCSSAYWPTWLRRVRVPRRTTTPRTLFQAKQVTDDQHARKQIGQAEGQVAPGIQRDDPGRGHAQQQKKETGIHLCHLSPVTCHLS